MYCSVLGVSFSSLMPLLRLKRETKCKHMEWKGGKSFYESQQEKSYYVYKVQSNIYPYWKVWKSCLVLLWKFRSFQQRTKELLIIRALYFTDTAWYRITSFFWYSYKIIQCSLKNCMFPTGQKIAYVRNRTQKIWLTK